jgi:hypothetical protein
VSWMTSAIREVEQYVLHSWILYPTGFELTAPAMQLLACVFEAMRAICIKQMQRVRSQGFNLAESLLLLALPSACLLLSMSASFEGLAMLRALPWLWRSHKGLIAVLAASSFLTDLTCYLALTVRPRSLSVLRSTSAVDLRMPIVIMTIKARILMPVKE